MYYLVSDRLSVRLSHAGTESKLCKLGSRKVILFNNTLTVSLYDGGKYHLFMIFAVFDVQLVTALAVNVCINCSFVHLYHITLIITPCMYQTC